MKDKDFVSFPDMKISYYVTDKNDSEKIILRIDEGEWSGVIISLTNFEFDDDLSSTMKFDMQVIYSNGKNTKDESFYDIVKESAKNIITYAVKGIVD